MNRTTIIIVGVVCWLAFIAGFALLPSADCGYPVSHPCSENDRYVRSTPVQNESDQQRRRDQDFYGTIGGIF
jgi:hypothetical protein